MPSLASRRPAHPRPHPRPRGFTLIELLIVTIIILVLAAIGLSVGSSVSRSGKAQATKQVLAVLDQSLSEYIQAKGTPPPAYHTDAAGRVFPLIDAVVVQEEYAQDSVAAYVMALSEVPSAAAIIERLDSEFIRAYAGPRPGNIDVKNMLFWPVGGGQVVFGPLPAATTDTPIRTILDGYGNPIRFVHPEFHGGYGYLVASQRRTDATALSFGPPPVPDRGLLPHLLPPLRPPHPEPPRGRRRRSLHRRPPVLLLRRPRRRPRHAGRQHLPLEADVPAGVGRPGCELTANHHAGGTSRWPRRAGGGTLKAQQTGRSAAW